VSANNERFGVLGLGLLTSMTGYVASWVLKRFSMVRAEQGNVPVLTAQWRCSKPMSLSRLSGSSNRRADCPRYQS
jgi:hypothetical protein